MNDYGTAVVHQAVTEAEKGSISEVKEALELNPSDNESANLAKKVRLGAMAVLQGIHQLKDQGKTTKDCLEAYQFLIYESN